MTPRQFDALMKRKNSIMQHEEFLSAQIAAMIGNFSMAHPKEPFKPADFMPSRFGEKQSQKPRRRKTKKQLVHTLNAIFGVVHGN